MSDWGRADLPWLDDRIVVVTGANSGIGLAGTRAFAEAGALPMLFAATSDELERGEYVGPGGFTNMRGAPEVQFSSEASSDEVTAERLWDVSVTSPA